jgi:peptidoglycan hydrolase CwlO-like protein
MLLEPAEYLNHLVEGPLKEYNTAKARLADVAGDLQKTQDEIKRAERALDEKRKTLKKAARAALLEASAPPVKLAPQVA